ncbi:unnamed protein product [Meloidogyne enterolobii]|uniref:Uncharacterized protein n=1 Tax=Meloidogyne enterolobii TaxID=390850 RepID=A0ACB0Y312_MELEN
MDFRGQKMDYAKSTKIAHCLPNDTVVAEPVTWKINGTEPKSNHNNLLVFHMLPQESARINSGDESNIRVSPKGPESYKRLHFIGTKRSTSNNNNVTTTANKDQDHHN